MVVGCNSAPEHKVAAHKRVEFGDKAAEMVNCKLMVALEYTTTEVLRYILADCKLAEVKCKKVDMTVVAEVERRALL